MLAVRLNLDIKDIDQAFHMYGNLIQKATAVKELSVFSISHFVSESTLVIQLEICAQDKRAINSVLCFAKPRGALPKRARASTETWKW
jgi:hypothetical protein